MGAFRSGIEVEELFAKISGFKSFRHSSKVHDPSIYEHTGLALWKHHVNLLL